MEIKFTTDGKKVVVLSALNSQEKIVQEIFVSETGQEFPGGENFVVKSLLDAPAKSWKQTTIEKLEAEFEAKRKQLELETENLYKKLRGVSEKSKAVISAFDAIAKNFDPSSLDHIKNILEGRVNFVVTKRYSDFYLYPIHEAPIICDGKTKLISMWGSANGDFSFRIHDYYDGSGNGWNPIWFFETEQQAKDFLQSELDGVEKYIDQHFKVAEKHGLKLDNGKQAAYYKALLDSKKNAIEVADFNKRGLMIDADDLENKIKSLTNQTQQQ